MANSMRDKLLAFLNRPAYDDYFITGGTGRSALNDNVLAASGSAAIDTMAIGNGLGSAKSFSIQVVGSAGISAGAVSLEVSNDNTNWTNAAYVTGPASSSTFTGAAATVAASAIVVFQGPILFRYLRLRISTAFVGGTVSATARLLTAPYAAPATAVLQGTATNLRTANTPSPASSGGNSIFTGSVGSTATQVKSIGGQIYGWHFHNPNAAISYVQFFNTAVGSVTVGTTPPIYSIGIPANGTSQVELPMGLPHSTAIVVAATTTRTGGTAPGSTVDVNVFYT